MTSEAGSAESHSREKDDDMTQRKAVFPASRHALYEQHDYSAAVRSDNLLVNR